VSRVAMNGWRENPSIQYAGALALMAWAI
jgi:hypothetical protein